MSPVKHHTIIPRRPIAEEKLVKKIARLRLCSSGFTLFELTFVVMIGMVVTTISVPMTKNALKAYHLKTAASSISGAIQSARYQAIMRGYHYNIAFNPASQSYQVASKVPPAASFSNVGSAVPWSSTGDVTMGGSTTTLEFFPGGTVSATSGSMSVSVSNGTATKTITVSGVGNVTVTP